MSNQEPEALLAADALESIGRALGDIPSSARQIAIHELRRLHARVQELEAMLEAPQPQADALDAARYRYLRDVDWRYSGELEAVIRLQANALWDVKIDEAIAAQTRSQGDSA